jgi:hypothetical protein
MAFPGPGYDWALCQYDSAYPHLWEGLLNAWVPSIGLRNAQVLQDVGPLGFKAVCYSWSPAWGFDPRIGITHPNQSNQLYVRSVGMTTIGHPLPYPALSVVTVFHTLNEGGSVNTRNFRSARYYSTSPEGGWSIGWNKNYYAAVTPVFYLVTTGGDDTGVIGGPATLESNRWYTMACRYDGINTKTVDIFYPNENVSGYPSEPRGYETYPTTLPNGGPVFYHTDNYYRLYYHHDTRPETDFGPVLIYGRDIGLAQSLELGLGGADAGGIYKPFLRRTDRPVFFPDTATYLYGSSDLSLTDSVGIGYSLGRGAESTLSLTQSATPTIILTLAGSNDLALTDEADGWTTEEIEVSEGSTLSLSQSAEMSAVFSRSGDSTLALSQDVGVQHVYNLSASNTLVLTDAAGINTVLSLEAENNLQEIRWEFLPGTVDLVEVITGLSDSAGVNTVLNIGVESNLLPSQSTGWSRVAVDGISASAENTLSLTQYAYITELADAVSTLTLTQSVTVDACKPADSELALTQSATVEVVRGRTCESTLALSQAASYVLIKSTGVQLCQYAPMVGANDDPDAPTPPSATLQGPMDGILVPFQLVYPAVGIVTDAVSLRAPNLGNRDQLSFDRIQRESRGGTLTTYADPMWPKVQTLVLDFSGLYRVEAIALLEFMDDHLGEEVGMIDWEQRYWKGIISTPDEPIIEDQFDQFSASFNFEGELDPTWNPQVVPPTLRVSAIRSTAPQNYYEPGEPEVPTEDEDYYSAEADETILVGQPVYLKVTGHVALAKADAAATTQVAGIAQNAVAAGSSCHYLTEGEITQTNWTLIAGTATLTIGATYYLDLSTAGRITSTSPTAVGNYVVRVGRATTSTTLDIEIELPILL